MPNAIMDKLKSLVPGPLKAFAGALGLGSPSRIFHQFGVDTIQGYINGIASMGPAVTAVMQSVAPTPAALGPMPSGVGVGTPNQANRRGPAIVIEEAHFHDELDIEVFMRKAGWLAQTQGV